MPAPFNHKRTPSARHAAIQILRKQAQSGRSVDLITEDLLQEKSYSDKRDEHLVMALVYGVLRWQGFFDVLLERFSSRPLQKIEPIVLDLLRVCLFQVYFLDRIPPAVAINETLEAGKALRLKPWLINFANALLRQIIRTRATLPDPWDSDSLLATHPAWLIDRWKKRYGLEQTLAICRANNSLPSLDLRVNTRMIAVSDFLQTLSTIDWISAAPGIASPCAVRLLSPCGPVQQLPGFKEGFFQVQGEAAQLVTLLMDNREHGAYLDGCAGVGGKTSQLAELLPMGVRIVAAEPNHHRFKLLEENIARLKQPRVQLIADTIGSEAVLKSGPYDGILIDAPCSGIGVIRRQPDIRWNRSESDLAGYQRQQLSLLSEATAILTPGGTIVYATCSTEPEENDEVIRLFLSAHKDFTVTSAEKMLPRKATHFLDSKGYFRTLPDSGLDGFFAARLHKKP